MAPGTFIRWALARTGGVSHLVGHLIKFCSSWCAGLRAVRCSGSVRSLLLISLDLWASRIQVLFQFERWSFPGSLLRAAGLSVAPDRTDPFQQTSSVCGRQDFKFLQGLSGGHSLAPSYGPQGCPVLWIYSIPSTKPLRFVGVKTHYLCGKSCGAHFLASFYGFVLRFVPPRPCTARPRSPPTAPLAVSRTVTHSLEH